MILGLTVILILVLFMPFTVKIVERNLEVFLFIMGIAAVVVSQVLDLSLIIKALKDPIYITLAVLLLVFCLDGFNPDGKRDCWNE